MTAAASCGRTRGNRVAGTNLANGSWTAERVALLRIMCDEGLSNDEIGRRLGVSSAAIAGKVHRLALPGRRPPRTCLAAPPKRPEPPREQPQPVESGRGCAWIRGDVPKWPALPDYCGEPCKTGSPYCAAHSKRAYAPQRKRDAAGSTVAA